MEDVMSEYEKLMLKSKRLELISMQYMLILIAGECNTTKEDKENLEALSDDIDRLVENLNKA